MRNFQNYDAEKYQTPAYHQMETGIYRTANPYDSYLGNDEVYVTSLSFEMEPDCYGEEDGSPRNITQTPFEDLLDEFELFITDFYYALNEQSEKICYQEFGSFSIEHIRDLRGIIGKRFYAVPDEKTGFHTIVIA